MGDVDGNVELLPAGTLRRVPFPSFNAGIQDVIALPDGGLVVVGTVDLQPGVPRPDGDGVTGLQLRLVAQRANGSVVANRNIRIPGQAVSLIGADRQSAVLWRSTGIVVHQLTTGVETRLPAASEIFARPGRKPVSVSTEAHLIAGWVAGTGTDLCPTPIVAGYDGRLTMLRLPKVTSQCGVLGLRLSPHGDALAVAYAASVRTVPLQARLAVFDSYTGRLISDSALFSTRWPVDTEFGGTDLRGLAWLDDRTVRAAVDALPDGADRVYRYQDLLRPVDITVR